jgi:threonine/homoserine/homoserine lactone efflux protein
MDRTALAGFGGSLASISGSLHEIVGLIAGAMTIIYMAVKIYQEIKNK